MSTHLTSHDVEPDIDLDDPNLTRFELVKAGARRDGVEIVHYRPRFPVRGTRREKRIVRMISLMFLLGGLAATAFVVAYIWWPWSYKPGFGSDKWYTPVLGFTLGMTLLLLGFAVITWGKKLLPEEIAVQDRHDGASPEDERRMTGATILNMGDELGLRRRPLLLFAAAAGLAPVAVAAAAPLIGGLIKDPHKPDVLLHTGWTNGVRLVRDDLTPIRPEEVSVGGQMTVFPGIAGGNTDEYADSPTLLIHLRAQDADTLRANLRHIALNSQANNGNGAMYGNLVAYSKICTHAGCPASLYEQQTNRLLCPCHQSQFNIVDNARPIFGPATRRLPMLPIGIDADGYLIATADYGVPVGPGFWEEKWQ